MFPSGKLLYFKKLPGLLRIRYVAVAYIVYQDNLDFVNSSGITKLKNGQ